MCSSDLYEALIRFALASGNAPALAEGMSLTLQVWPHNRLALRVSAELLALRGGALRGIALLGRLVAEDPSDTDMQQALATLQSHNDQMPAALLTLEKATRSDPPPAVLVEQLARYYVRAGRRKDAAALAERVRRAHPDEPEYAVVEADTFLELGRAADAHH